MHFLLRKFFLRESKKINRVEYTIRAYILFNCLSKVLLKVILKTMPQGLSLFLCFWIEKQSLESLCMLCIVGEGGYMRLYSLKHVAQMHK